MVRGDAGVADVELVEGFDGGDKLFEDADGLVFRQGAEVVGLEVGV